MTDAVLVTCTVVLTGAFAIIMTIRIVVVERAAHREPAGSRRPTVVRRLDWAGGVLVASIIAAVVFRVVNTVL